MAKVTIPNWPNTPIEITLNPCRCGSENVIADGGGCVWIECEDCGETGPEHESLRVAAEEWNRLHAQPEKSNETPECERCGRKKSVKPTALGRLCQYCRATDKRHMRSVRDLGGIPIIDGQPVTNADYNLRN